MPRRSVAAHAIAALVEPLEGRSLFQGASWDGGGDNASWGDPLNWAGDVLPGPGDTATIDTSSGTGAITIAGTFTVGAFASARPLSLTSGSLTFSGASQADAQFTLAGGTLAGAGGLTITASMLWSSGGMTGAGAIVVQAGATFVIDGGGTFSKPVTNAGTVTWVSGAVQHDTGAFTNQAGALFRVQADAAWTGTGAFSNAGAINKLGGAAATISSAFTNTGSISVLAGTLTLGGNGANTGSLKVFPGTVLEFLGNVSHGAGGSYSGAGTIRVNGGTHTFGVNAAIASRFAFNSGIVQGAGNTTFTSGVTWIGGTFSGAGDTILSPSAVLTITGGIAKFLVREMIVNGTIQWVQGTLSLAGGRLVTGGTVNITGNAVILGAGGVSVVAHHGTLVKTSTGTMTISVPVQGTGSWSVLAGTLTLSGGGGGTGNRFVAAGATLRFTNDYAHNGGAITGAGTVLLDGGTHTIGVDINANALIELNQGLLTGPGDLFIGTRFEWNGGSMAGGGFSVIRPGAEMEITSGVPGRELRRRVVNNGEMNWTGGDLRAQGGSIVNGTGRTITITSAGAFTSGDLGGTVINFGTIVKAGAGSMEFEAASAGAAGARMSNKGTLQVAAGTLSLAGGVLQLIAGNLVEGAWSVGAAGTLNFGSAAVAAVGAAATLTLTGATASFTAIGSLSANRGTLVLATGAQWAVAPLSGQFTNTGTIRLGRGCMLLIAGSFIQGAAGHLRTDIAGTGVSNFGRVVASGAATLAGSLTVAYVGFTPASGQSFQFLQSGSRVGQFTTTTLPPTPAASVSYLANGARVTIA